MTDPMPAVEQLPAETGDLPLIAYYEPGHPDDLPIVPAARLRSWIEDAARHGRHCLPLMMASQNGWFVLNNQAFTARWSGEVGANATEVEYDGPEPRFRAHSAFGHGILSFMIPYLFRTPPGYNMLARGPANWPRDGIAPLEGLVETDWSVATFTMNWKFTRPGAEVRFEKDEPVCMLVPQRRGELERFAPKRRSIKTNPQIQAGNAAFNERRHKSLVARFAAEFAEGAGGPAFEGDYMRGVTPTGERAQEHQRKLDLKDFQRGA
jgi:hypothetical protein